MVPALNTLGRDEICKFDELILSNNSCFFPVFNPTEMFGKMNSRYLDFWAVSSFPKISNSNREEAGLLPQRMIPQHLQSYFQVFGASVLKSDAFWNFWDSVRPTENIVEVVARYETQLTRRLHAAGFRSGCYVPEFEELQRRESNINDFNAVYSRPIFGFSCRSPFVKKKVSIYAPADIPAMVQLVKQQATFPIHLLDGWI